MLTYLLVWTVALGSLAIYFSSYIFEELGRKNDLIWTGIGLFYALILWVYADEIGGGLLLGQMAGVSMLVWFGWQTLRQRRQLTPVDQQTPVPDWLQKVIDVVQPLWEKATGSINNLLGIEPGPEDAVVVGRLEFSEIKTKAMNLLDRLNQNSGLNANVADVEVAESSEEEDEDWDEEIEAAEDEVDIEEDNDDIEAVDDADDDEAIAEDETDEIVVTPSEVVSSDAATLETPPSDPEPEAETEDTSETSVTVETPATSSETPNAESVESPEAQGVQPEAPVNSEEEPSEMVEAQESIEPTSDAVGTSATSTAEASEIADPSPDDVASDETTPSPSDQEEKQENSNWPPEPIN